MIHVRMSVTDLGRTRFAYSPLMEVAESLYMLSAREVRPYHRGWFNAVRDRLRTVDLALLCAVVPARNYIADFFSACVTGPATTIEQQLQAVTGMPPERLRAEIQAVWRGDPPPPVARELIEAGTDGSRRLADALWDYWSVAIQPYWREMRAVLDDDVASRAAELTRGGVGALLADLHPRISVRDEMLVIDKMHSSDQDLSGAGLLLVPSVFVWPHLVFASGTAGPPSLIYGARGVGNLWGTPPPPVTDEDALGALLGRSRAAILTFLALPHSTTELALKLGQSPPSISQHLSVLRRSGLVVSWRSGRSVLYRRTALATSIVEASLPVADRADPA